jgi:tyrosinase
MGTAAATFVRREIWGMAANDPVVTSYARAVEVMKARPASDPTSWAYQAAIHGSEATPSKSLWNEYQHKSWFFML